MSLLPNNDPVPGDKKACDALESVIVPRVHDLGGLQVRRALPSVGKKMIGPFIFFDQMGPSEFLLGNGLDVRPHPHIGLSTVTYLFNGEIMHRDSLGTELAIKPGAINWMTAGRGIAHSERTPAALRTNGSSLFGIQTWVALPASHEETEPDFIHHAEGSLPIIQDRDKEVRLITGSLFGETSPVPTFTDTVYADAQLNAGASLPLDPSFEERGVYVVTGTLDIAGDQFEAGQLLVFNPGDQITIKAVTQTRFMILGGEAMDGPRHIWWNFVSSRKDRIEEAKDHWREGRFEAVQGEAADEFISLP